LLQTLQKAGVESPELSPGQEGYNGLLTHLMNGDVKSALGLIQKLAPDADLKKIQMDLYMFT